MIIKVCAFLLLFTLIFLKIYVEKVCHNNDH